MRKRNTAVISVLVLCAVAVGAFWITSNSAAQSNTGDISGKAGDITGGPQVSSAGNISTGPFAAINDKSRAAKAGGAAEVRALADEIFTTYQLDEAPAGLGDVIKERLVRAEVSYRSGKGQHGISDASIVRAVNYLAYKVDAPAFARTNVFELRRMKSAMLPYTANMQAGSGSPNRLISRNGKPTDPTTPTMSPLEATLFLVSLVQQKQFNTEYQLTNEEFVALHGGKREAKSDKLFRGEMQSRQNNLSRSSELEQSVEKNATVLGVANLINLPAELMYVLGVDK